MGKGRPKIFDEVKKLRGTDQPCRMSGNIDQADKLTSIDQITSTAKLKVLKTKRAKDIFKTKANQLIALGVLTEMDIEHLALYAFSLDFVFTCMSDIMDNVEKGARMMDGIAIKEVNTMFKAFDYVNRLGADFGFTPMSRQKMNQSPKEEEDELSQFLSGIR